VPQHHSLFAQDYFGYPEFLMLPYELYGLDGEKPETR
jgi:hypothetical protein